MSKASLAFLLFGLLVATVQGDLLGLPCCSELETSLKLVKKEVEDLELLVKYLVEQLTAQFHWKATTAKPLPLKTTTVKHLPPKTTTTTVKPLPPKIVTTPVKPLPPKIVTTPVKPLPPKIETTTVKPLPPKIETTTVKPLPPQITTTTVKPLPPTTSTANPVICPDGFTLLPSTGRCYKVVHERHNWTSAGEHCQGLYHDAQLVFIQNKTESDAVTVFLKSEIKKFPNETGCEPKQSPNLGNMFWTSGQRDKINDCNSKFVWKQSSGVNLPLTFVNWMQGEPSCGVSGGNRESCLEIWSTHNFMWNDVGCDMDICPVCQYTP